MKQINSIQTKDYIADAIRDEILSGGLQNEEELTQEALAEMLGVSRMPVREALQTLVQEGFVKRLPNRHMQVIAPGSEQVREIFGVIGAIEIQIVEQLVAKTEDAQLLKELEKNVIRIKEATDQQRSRAAELAFHRQLVGYLNNQYLVQLFERLQRGYLSYAIRTGPDHRRGVDQLIRLVNALRMKQTAAVKTEIMQYYRNLADHFGQRKEADEKFREN